MWWKESNGEDMKKVKKEDTDVMERLWKESERNDKGALPP